MALANVVALVVLVLLGSHVVKALRDESRDPGQSRHQAIIERWEDCGVCHDDLEGTTKKHTKHSDCYLLDPEPDGAKSWYLENYPCTGEKSEKSWGIGPCHNKPSKECCARTCCALGPERGGTTTETCKQATKQQQTTTEQQTTSKKDEVFEAKQQTTTKKEDVSEVIFSQAPQRQDKVKATILKPEEAPWLQRQKLHPRWDECRVCQDDETERHKKTQEDTNDCHLLIEKEPDGSKSFYLQNYPCTGDKSWGIGPCHNKPTGKCCAKTCCLLGPDEGGTTSETCQRKVEDMVTSNAAKVCKKVQQQLKYQEGRIMKAHERRLQNLPKRFTKNQEAPTKGAYSKSHCSIAVVSEKKEKDDAPGDIVRIKTDGTVVKVEGTEQKDTNITQSTDFSVALELYLKNYANGCTWVDATSTCEYVAS